MKNVKKAIKKKSPAKGGDESVDEDRKVEKSTKVEKASKVSKVSKEEKEEKEEKEDDEDTLVEGGPILFDGMPPADNPEGENEVSWFLKNNSMRFTVGKQRGNSYVDIRHLWEGKPTKKGARLSVELFRAMQKWPGFDAALEKLK